MNNKGMISVKRCGFVIAVLFVILKSSLCAQALNLLWFYPHVDSVIRFPNAQYKLTIMCSKRIDKRYVTFVGTKGSDKALLAAITMKPLTDVSDASISLTVRFYGVTPGVGKVSTWAYIFDRNHDGNIDYMALLAGAGPVKTDDVPENFPKRGQPLSRANIEVFVSHCSLIFDHWADDNFDDTLDAVIHHDMDPLRDWVQRQIAVRSTNFDGKFDSVSTFRLQPGDLEGDTLAYTSGWVPFYPVGKTVPDAITHQSFIEATEYLHLVNRAARLCGLTGNNFYPLLPED